jgi:16S rRNA C967 or C1407 C5-methylase (RsmB/RsmF family)
MIFPSPGIRPWAGCFISPAPPSRRKNEAVITAFLAAHPEFHLAADLSRLPRPARPLIKPPGFFRTSPAEHDLDGFFAGVLAKGK